MHIECVQDKLDDCEKLKEVMKRQWKQQEDESGKEMHRYKDLLGLREKEVDTMKAELRKMQKNNEDLRNHCELLEQQVQKFGQDIKRTGSVINFGKSTGEDSIIYNNNFDS